MRQNATETGRVNIRAAGVCIVDGHVLLQSEDQIDFWVLPGGRPLLLESSDAALRREMLEEIDAAVEVGRLLWTVENFFEYEGQPFHELCFYYEMNLPDGHSFTAVGAELIGAEGDRPLLYRWFPLAALDRVCIYPTFLASALTGLPPSIAHVVHWDG